MCLFPLEVDDKMKRRFLVLGCATATLAALTALTACSSGDSVAPTVRTPAPATPSFTFGGDWHDGNPVPGSSGNASNAHTQPIACTIATGDSVTKIIGASGGEIDAGPSHLIIPPGALTKDTAVTAVVPAGNTIVVKFSPQGLHFKKPAGLILDASTCTKVPDVLYINEVGGENELITAIYANWWHVVAAPLDHFSQYMLAM